jgi:hypothetical protein
VKIYHFTFLMAGLLFIGCGKKDAAKAQARTNSGSSVVSAPSDYLGTVVRTKQNAEATVSTAGLQQQINLFQAQEGRLPKDLNELVSPNYLSRLPGPPQNMKYDYNPATGEVKIVPK